MTEIVGLTNASVQYPIVDGITASTTQTEGNGQLTKAVSVVSTVANANDTVTLPVLTKGMSCVVINTGANVLKVYAGSSGTIDDKTAGTPVYILPKGSQTFWRYGTTPPAWMSANYDAYNTVTTQNESVAVNAASILNAHSPLHITDEGTGVAGLNCTIPTYNRMMAIIGTLKALNSTEGIEVADGGSGRADLGLSIMSLQNGLTPITGIKRLDILGQRLRATNPAAGTLGLTADPPEENIAAAGTTQGDAQQATADVIFITFGVTNSGIRLPTITDYDASRKLLIYNGTANYIKLYPYSGQTLFGHNSAEIANAPIVLAPGRAFTAVPWGISLSQISGWWISPLSGLDSVYSNGVCIMDNVRSLALYGRGYSVFPDSLTLGRLGITNMAMNMLQNAATVENACADINVLSPLKATATGSPNPGAVSLGLDYALKLGNGTVTLDALQVKTSGNISLTSVNAGAKVVGIEVATSNITLNAFRTYDVREIVTAKGDTGAATVTLDLATANVFTAKATGNVTWVFSNPAPSGQASTLTLILQNGEAYTMTWPGAVKWSGGTKPTLTATGYDVLTFITVDGGTIWRGALNQKDSK